MNFNIPFIKSNINKFKVKSDKNTLTLMGKVLMFLKKQQQSPPPKKNKLTSFQKTKYDRKRARIPNTPNPNGIQP